MSCGWFGSNTPLPLAYQLMPSKCGSERMPPTDCQCQLKCGSGMPVEVRQRDVRPRDVEVERALDAVDGVGDRLLGCVDLVADAVLDAVEDARDLRGKTGEAERRADAVNDARDGRLESVHALAHARLDGVAQRPYRR